MDAKADIHADGERITVLPPSKRMKLLGIQITPLRGELNDMLLKTLRASLKPQQKIVIFREHIIPKMLHILLHVRVAGGTLERLDKEIRTAVRAACRLPHDLRNSFIYAHVQEGGLGMWQLKTEVPFRRLAMLMRVGWQELDGTQLALREQMWVDIKLRALRQFGLAGSIKVTFKVLGELKSRLRKNTREALVITAQGHEIQPFVVDLSNAVFRGSVSYLKGWECVQFLRLRTNNLTKKITARRRGAPVADDACRSCKRRSEPEQSETLAHVLGFCPGTLGMRIDRHNRVRDFIYESCIEKGYHCLRAKMISTRGGDFRPDLIVK